uniref:Coproporphyrinogen III oxidase n=2 Tax=Chromera velia TaxID=505693 RepID=G4W928_9ALVE|nr:coproporphyrinogen III oxidase [Chromera velia]|mmetsp:Transcript_20905/g.41683  ORF Transcript_20905/g.41683 Transcript_20905/m.41683 type:complete len:412 (+) Transcript_20905:155-1390(+)|eukprot:Cvel_2641.t1-p1 / transcript=Cvel_2641.t1 / gene=Cvel_2641 / organism=Chromera_velia_CCMP2878 / gene_product=Coproporphyrinogen-III oxidase, chloroplastic, putative / transcript_product=Coproporphyrinogen-III oxidase, chloroplastic, putative / location=Cvel_scaffold104:125266-126498(+) / protein_length=411 / sequence_SO=supercontig / SO=protein_coding / is_pseudo=false
MVPLRTLGLALCVLLQELAGGRAFSASTFDVLSSAHGTDRWAKRRGSPRPRGSRRGLGQSLFAAVLPQERGDASVHGVDSTFDIFSSFLRRKQAEILNKLEEVDGKGKFVREPWSQEETGSEGLTAVLEGGDVIEKGACSTSFIKGVLSVDRARAMKQRKGADGWDLKGGETYRAAALSLVFHSRSPLVPTFRADVRYFEVEGKPGWFGGGADLTPYYLFDDDVREFHGFWKEVCNRFSPRSFPVLKRQCDDYFYLPARREHRGVGGIFFDDLVSFESLLGTSETGGDAVEGEQSQSGSREALEFTKAVAEGWLDSWLPIVERRRGLEFTDQEKEWQLIRRGRYLEFNLLYDRGVKFGLAGPAVSTGRPVRVEAVMVSAPPEIKWKYKHEVPEGSEEARLVEVLKKPRDWV